MSEPSSGEDVACGETHRKDVSLGVNTHRSETLLPLNPTQRKIRILRLLPGIGGPVCGDLETVDLDDTTEPYICASYVWGDASITKAVYINGQELRVTTNLFDLLQHIRHPRETRTLWVDAICINQDDIMERSHQVALMDDVYSLCSSVYVWLGAPEALETIRKDPFLLFDHYAAGKHYHDLPGYTWLGHEKWAFDEHDPEFQEIWEAFSLVVKNSWWTRAWTVQEIILPAQSTIHFGRWKTTYETISLARNRRDAQLKGCCAQSRAVQPFAIRHQLDHFLGEIARIDLVHYPQFKPGHSVIGDIIRSSQASQLPTLYPVLLSFAARNCKDHRDKVFSILGLAKNHAIADFGPDYAAPIAECYTSFFMRMIDQSDGDYRILLGSSFGPSLPGMPSWVRDFSQPYSSEAIGQEIRRLQVYNLYNASGSSTGRLKVLNRNELQVSAVKSEVITVTGPVMSNLFDSPQIIQQTLREWLRIYNSYAEESSGIRAQAHSRIARTLSACLRNDMSIKDFYWRRDTEEECPTFTALEQILNGDFSALDDGYVPGVAMSTTNRAFYMTESGSSGLCNPKVKSGDRVWALVGAKVPFVLRKADDAYVGQNAYQFIGDCFLFGSMDGEIIQRGAVEEDVILV